MTRTHLKTQSASFLALILGLVISVASFAQGQPDDLRRGVAILREDTALFEKPDESSRVAREQLEIGKRYFVLGLTLDGTWAQLITRRNVKGWVLVSKINRLPESDPEMHGDFLKLVDRSHWITKRLTLNFGAYPTQDFIGEVGFTLLPRGIGGLKGETLDLVGGAVLVKATPDLESHNAYRVLLQWPFRMLAEGNLHIGPRAGYETRKRYNPVGVKTSETSHLGVMGVLFRYMPNSMLGLSIVPEFLIHAEEAEFHAFVALTLML